MAHSLSRKTCSSCKRELDISFFGKRPEYKDGFRNQCNPCRSTKTAAYFNTDRGIENRNAFRAKEKASRPPDKLRWEKIRLKYNLDQPQYDAILAKQDGVCAICAGDDPRGRFGVFVVDHCHRTGRTRGLLCSSCNTAIGMLGDDSDGVARALNYLLRAER